jgi:hypothetical protein
MISASMERQYLSIHHMGSCHQPNPTFRQVSLEFLTTFFEDSSRTIQDVWYNHSKAYSGLNSRVLENMQLYIQVLQYDVIVLHNGLYLLSHNIYWD